MKRFATTAILAAFLAYTALQAQTTGVKVPAKTLESYIGQYELMPGFVLTIRKEGDELTGQATGQPRVRLIAQSEVEFKIRGVEASMSFVKDKDGKVTRLVLHQNGEHEAAKVSDTVPKERVAIKVNPSIYDAYVGQYELAPGAIFVVRRDGDKLRVQLTGQPSFQVFPESEKDFFYKVVDAQLTFITDASGKATSLVLHQNGDKPARKTSNDVPPVKGPDLTKVPPRDPKAKPQLADLSGKYTAPLTEQWHPDVNGLPAGGNHLGSLPRGVQTFAGTEFDVRGVIQLTGAQAEFAGAAFPDAQAGLPLGRKCKKLHFLHATGWQAEDGTVVGKYILHYAGGERATLDIVYGADTRDWWVTPGDSKTTKSAAVAWSGTNPATEGSGASIRLFKRTYDNPKPDQVIESVDFVSAQADAAPFLVAFTVED